MKTNEELYGVGVVVPPIPTEHADIRIKLLNDNLKKLLKVGFMKQDNDAIREVQTAINFWKKLKEGEEI